MLPEANITMLAPFPAVPAAPVWDVGHGGGSAPAPRGSGGSGAGGSLQGAHAQGWCTPGIWKPAVWAVPPSSAPAGGDVSDAAGHQPHGLFPRQLGLLTASPPPATMGRSVSHSHEVTEPVTSPLSSGDGPRPREGSHSAEPAELDAAALSPPSQGISLDGVGHPIPNPQSPALQPPGCHQGWVLRMLWAVHGYRCADTTVRLSGAVPGEQQPAEGSSCSRPTADWKGQTARLIREYLTPVKGEKHTAKAKCFSENKLNLESCQAGGSESSKKKKPTPNPGVGEKLRAVSTAGHGCLEQRHGAALMGLDAVCAWQRPRGGQEGNTA